MLCVRREELKKKKKKEESDYGFPPPRKHPEEGTQTHKKELRCTKSHKWRVYIHEA